MHARRTVSIDVLLGALWEDPPARAVTVLRTYASRLRRVLETDRARPRVLPMADNGYVLQLPEGCLDVEVLEERTVAAGRARAEGDMAGAAGLLRAVPPACAAALTRSLCWWLRWLAAPPGPARAVSR
ncbi:hypothetical protein [Streptomyces sp. NPDC001678]|uniref:AfsR/SARP family transcriptional regulator n=1 Tax=Streptomyces sp. NPDC001678 TaxID=3364599 RepID=UPI0036C5A865